MKTLLLMRHAKSDWAAEMPDHERPLNRRGVEAARHMGRKLNASGLVPERIISSTAVRARTTAELANEGGGWGIPVELDPDFYGRGPGPVIDRVRGGGAEVRLMIVGHQPTWGLIAHELTGETVEVKTATVVVVGFAIEEWSAVSPGSGTLEAVHHPRR